MTDKWSKWENPTMTALPFFFYERQDWGIGNCKNVFGKRRYLAEKKKAKDKCPRGKSRKIFLKVWILKKDTVSFIAYKGWRPLARVWLQNYTFQYTKNSNNYAQKKCSFL